MTGLRLESRLECERDDPRAAVVLQSTSLSRQVPAEVLEEQIVPYCVGIQLDVSKKTLGS